MKPDSSKPPRLRTPGFIANELGEPLHRVLYVLRTRKHNSSHSFSRPVPARRRAAVAMVRHALNGIAARNCRKEGEQ